MPIFADKIVKIAVNLKDIAKIKEINNAFIAGNKENTCVNKK